MVENAIVTRLRRYRDAKHLTIKGLARELDVSTDAIRRWFYKKRPGKTMRRLLNFYLGERGY